MRLIAIVVVVIYWIFGAGFLRATRSLSSSFLIDKVIKTSVHEIEKDVRKKVVWREASKTTKNR